VGKFTEMYAIKIFYVTSHVSFGIEQAVFLVVLYWLYFL